MKILRIIFIFILLLSAIAIGYFIIYPTLAPDWTGFGPYFLEKNEVRAKTLWDWLGLLIIPSTLGLIGFLYNDYQKKKNEEKEKEQKLNNILDSYFKIMGQLITNSDLLDSKTSIKSKTLARTRTLVALENLDGERKGQILQFLYESNLINEKKIVDLNGANFQESELKNIVLRKATINGVYFKNSNLSNSHLENANLTSCDFEKSNLSYSSLDNTNLSYTNLTSCKLTNLDLTSANLEGAKLNYADLRGSKIKQDQLDSIFNKKGIIIDNELII